MNEYLSTSVSATMSLLRMMTPFVEEFASELFFNFRKSFAVYIKNAESVIGFQKSFKLWKDRQIARQASKGIKQNVVLCGFCQKSVPDMLLCKYVIYVIGRPICL